MTFKDRFRKAIGRSSDRSGSNSSSSTPNQTPTASSPPTGSNTPIPSTAESTNPSTARNSISGPHLPAITLTKTSTRLTKSLTWRSHTKDKPSRAEKKEKKKLETWQKKDAEEWLEPQCRYPGKKSQKHQDMLRSFEWKLEEDRRGSEGGKSISTYSGVSPGQSRVPSVDEETGLVRVLSGRKRSSGAGIGSTLSREASRADGPPGTGEPVGSVTEEREVP